MLKTYLPPLCSSIWSSGHYADIHGNEVYNDLGEATVTCGYSGPDSETTVPLSAFTSAGLMKGSSVHKTPSDETVLGWARELLGMPPKERKAA